jgi:hypothetical protein
MENNFSKFVNENKWFVVFYLMWSFLHITIFLTTNYNTNCINCDAGFWPFASSKLKDNYYYAELFVYMVFPLIIFVIWKLVGNDKKHPQ